MRTRATPFAGSYWNAMRARVSIPAARRGIERARLIRHGPSRSMIREAKPGAIVAIPRHLPEPKEARDEIVELSTARWLEFA